MIRFGKTNIRIVLIVLIFATMEYALMGFADQYVALQMEKQDLLHPALINFFRGITDYGKSIWYLVPCGLVTLFCVFLSRGKDVKPVYARLCGYIGVRTLFVFCTVGLSGIIADIIKPIVGRARPTLWLKNSIYGFDPFNAHGFVWNGMPSGHSTTVFALAASLSIFFPRLPVLWYAFAVLLAFSRIAVDAHYVSDVVAGAMLGWLTTRLFLKYGINHLLKVIFPIDGMRS